MALNKETPDKIFLIEKSYDGKTWWWVTHYAPFFNEVDAESEVKVLTSAIVDCRYRVIPFTRSKVLQSNRSKNVELKAKNNKRAVYTGQSLPKPGDIIYVGTHLYIDHGQDDVVGGKATVKSVKKDTSHNIGFIEVLEHPGTSYGWLVLRNEQKKLAAEFGDKWAYADPE